MFNNFLYDKLKNIINTPDKVYLKNQQNSFMMNMILCDYINNKRNIIVIMPNLYEAQKCYDEFTSIINPEDVLFYPADELIAAEMIDVSGDFKYERINTLISLLKDEKPYIVVTNLNGAIRKSFSKEKYLNNIIHIDMKSIIDEKTLYERLVNMGYTFSYTVTKTGEFSHRGSIIDIFPLNYQNPVRLDLFGDEIDTIKYFDPESQKSISKIDEFSIIPVTEMIFTDNELLSAIEKINDFRNTNSLSDEEKAKIDNDITNLNVRHSLDNLIRYANFFDETSTIFDIVNDKKVYMIDQKKCEDTFNHMINDLNLYCESINGYSLFKLNYFMDFNYLTNISNVISEGVVNVFKTGYEFLVSTPDDMKSNIEEISNTLKKNIKENTIVVLIKNQVRLDHLKELLLDNNIYYHNVDDDNKFEDGLINIINGEYYPSFKSDVLRLLVLNEKTLFDVKYEPRRPKYKSIYKNTTKISHYDELSVGDYVVHFDYGIGKYLGLKMMEANGIKRDYIHIEYAKGDALYIPLEQISSIEKYSAGEVKEVALTNLGTKSWSAAKAKVKKRIHDISQNLIKLYAKRNASIGYAFLPDSADQVLFEADFGYELTPDQARAISDIKREMESEKIMDRLVCGDVGYGKTEVALRAAFKAVMSGKQVAVLAPTTILSRQHYHTFKNRMDRFGIRVDLLNRMQKPKAIKESMEALARGEVDVIIGTHKLLGKDIQYHDLGLLIIDEEQRFGVVQKEKIKELKVNVDTITLSATPIPRTLQMSMMGIKSLSMLETPPKNRYPVQTYVLERNDSIIRDAIERELARGGQIFYMYNYTETIFDISNHIKALVPDARVCVGHGKMDKDELENIITDFIDKKYDVLVCTTIIETGIDIPDTNTLIIHDSNRLGLSQLYQLRGRVGRSDKIAYAYMMYEPHYILTESALKRLETIKEFNELGSGFKIAMRDLTIRGAGDLLGDSQSGFIDSVGLETYLHILDEEIKNINNPNPFSEIKEEQDPSLNKVLASRTISDNYINNEDVKIEIHKKIDKIRTIEDLNDLSNELLDRFGHYDDEIKVYMYEKLLSRLETKLEIKKILDTPAQIILFMSEKKSAHMDGSRMFELANNMSKDIELHYYAKRIEIVMNKAKYKNNEHLIILTKFLNALLNENK